MNIDKIALSLLAFVSLAVGCTDREPSFDKEKHPTEVYQQLNIVSGCGHNAATSDSEVSRAVWHDAEGEGSLILKWNSEDHLAFVVSDGEKPIAGRPSPEADTEQSYSSLSVAPHEGDVHHADFTTALYYNTDHLQRATYCYAVSGDVQIEERAEQGQHLAHIEMPATFTQHTNQEPSFLRPSMYMYAVAAYKGERTTLNFKHIPATLRFVVTNATSHDIVLQEASVGTSSGDAVAGASAGVVFDWGSGEAEVLLGKGNHEKVSVNVENGRLAAGEKYTAYALVLPLSESDALKGKTLNFSIKSDDQSQVAIELDGQKLAELNGNNLYNWVGGKSYTVRVTVREDRKATGEVRVDNSIEVVPVEAGIYTLLYEGEDGRPLAEYAEICTLTANEIGYYEDFIAENVAPRSAVNIGVYNSTGERQGTIPLAHFKPDYTEQPQYSFGLLSDVHIGRSEINPDTDFERALKFFNAKDVAHTCICGDITQNGKEAEYATYQNIAALSNAPIYTTTGNHDATSGGINPEVWSKYTHSPLVFERSVECGDRTDHYLFLGMERWNFSAAYLEYHLTWLERKLEEYRNERCFIITHLFFPDRAGNLNGIYPSGNWLKGAQLERLEAMCDRYVNTIWFSGHSHWEWWLQKYQDRANIYRTCSGDTPLSGWCVHVPSCGAPITSDGSTRVDNTAGSEGGVVEVYKDHIDILGIDFVSGKYLPVATYRLDTKLQTVAADNVQRPNYYLSASDFVENQNKRGATVTDLADNYVEVTFTAKSQGFYVANSTFTESATKVSITVEDVQAFANGEQITPPVGVGFYGTSGYYLVSTNSAQVKPESFRGVQFQTSGSKYGDGPLPLTIRMKAQMAFSE